MSVRWDVLGLGAVAVDDLLYVDQHPLPDAKLPVKARQRQGGGLAGTALVTAARLGVRAAYWGVLGDDELSRFTRQELEREGVDCTPTWSHPDARPFYSIVIVDLSTGSRTILYSAEGVMEPEPDRMSSRGLARPGCVPSSPWDAAARAGEGMARDVLTDCRVLFVDHTVVGAALYAIEVAHAAGIPVVGDIEAQRDPRLPALMDGIDHLILGLALAARITGESEPVAAVRALARPDRACCVVTAGEHGCWYSERDGPVRHVPAFRVQVVDTTGCGDVFHGAYAACIARGESVGRAVQVATAAAGIKATQPGGRRGIPDLAAVEEFLLNRDR